MLGREGVTSGGEEVKGSKVGRGRGQDHRGVVGWRLNANSFQKHGVDQRP